MRAVGMFEAKTHFSQIIAAVMVADSEGIYVTNRGEEVAVIISIDEYRKSKNADFWRRFKSFKEKYPIGTPEEVIEMKNEGRR